MQERIKIVEAYFVPKSVVSTTISKGLSRQKSFNQTHNKAPRGQIQGDRNCTTVFLNLFNHVAQITVGNNCMAQYFFA